MKTKHLFGILFSFLCTINCVSCSDNEENKEPEGYITLNMKNEQNGKTLLGSSDVYINTANNFKTSSCFIADMGKTSGLGTPTKTLLNNLSRETAVISNHLYHIYDEDVIQDFPSGTRAIMIGSGYYKAYVVAPITQEGITTGTVVKYVLAYPETNDLPECGENIGNIDYIGDCIEYRLPKNTELYFSAYLDDDKDAFDIQIKDGVLKVTLLKSINRIYGPYGDYTIYARSGTTFTHIKFQAGMQQ